MSEHSVFAFSASPRWIPCPGSMAYPENTAEEADGGVYADEGTAAHKLAAILLKSKTGMTAEDWIGKVIKGGNREFEITEEFAGHVQTYVDDVLRRALGGHLLVEQKLSLAGIEGFDESNYGTSDGVIAMPAKKDMKPDMIAERIKNTPKDKYERYAHGIIEDLKFGKGERVYAYTLATPESKFTFDIYKEDGAITVEPNYQLMMYALSALESIEMLVGDLTHMLLVICQPRLNNISELRVPIDVLKRFAVFAADALAKSMLALGLGPQVVEKDAADYLNPGEKQCRWCKAQARCPAAATYVQEAMASEFDVIDEAQAPIAAVPVARAYKAIPYILEWCKAVIAQAHVLASDGKLIGPDKQPYKFVEGQQGKRVWTDKAAAEELLLAQLGSEKAYKPKEIITAPAAGKLLDKKATKNAWNDMFKPLIKNQPSQPILVQGSDPRPAYIPVAGADEFETEDEE